MYIHIVGHFDCLRYLFIQIVWLQDLALPPAVHWIKVVYAGKKKRSLYSERFSFLE